jgi:hypothetical protein
MRAESGLTFNTNSRAQTNDLRIDPAVAAAQLELEAARPPTREGRSADGIHNEDGSITGECFHAFLKVNVHSRAPTNDARYGSARDSE